MMNYHLGRDGQQLGVFTREQMAAGLASGTLRGTDLAWAEGMESWVSIGTLFPQGMGAPHSAPPSHPASSLQPQTCGLAIASLVLGICSFVLNCLTALPAVICGHLALGRIKRSGDGLTGRGLAIAGLVLGYLFLALLPFQAAILLPVMKQVIAKRDESHSIRHAQQLMVELKNYAAVHQGRYPATLDELVNARPELEHLLDPPSSQSGWTGEKGFEYSGGSAADPGKKVILISRYHSPTGQRIVARNNGSVKVENNTRSP